jgi:tetratricopeptide (TPR) repeat protein
MSDKVNNYIEETKSLFRLLRTEAFRFIIVRYNHYSFVNQLKEDLLRLFPDRSAFTVDGSNTNYRLLVDSYYKAAKGFFYIENFEEILINPEIYTGLNQRRDKLALYPIALIVFISSGTEELYARQIMEKMPDLWSFRSLLLDLKVEISQPVQYENWNQSFVSEQVTTTTTTLGGSSPEEKEQELNRLLKRVSEVPDNELNLLVILYQQIAKILEDLWRHDEAIEYYLKLEKVEIEIGDKNGLGLTYSNIGAIYHNNGQWDKALEYYLNASKIFKVLDDKIGLGFMSFYIGLMYSNKGEWRIARKYYFKSEKIYKGIHYLPGLVSTYFGIGVGFTRNGDRKQGKDYIILAGFVARNQGMKAILSQMAWVLDPLIKKLGTDKFMEEGKKLYDQIVLGQ